MKLVYQHMVIFFNFLTTSNQLHPLQFEHCDSNSRLVADEDDNGKFRLERVKTPLILLVIYNWGMRTKPRLSHFFPCYLSVEYDWTKMVDLALILSWTKWPLMSWKLVIFKICWGRHMAHCFFLSYDTPKLEYLKNWLSPFNYYAATYPYYNYLKHTLSDYNII